MAFSVCRGTPGIPDNGQGMGFYDVVLRNGTVAPTALKDMAPASERGLQLSDEGEFGSCVLCADADCPDCPDQRPASGPDASRR